MKFDTAFADHVCHSLSRQMTGAVGGHFKTLEVGGPVDRSDRIDSDDEIGMVRGEKELGELPG